MTPLSSPDVPEDRVLSLPISPKDLSSLNSGIYSVLEINLSASAENYRILSKIASTATCSAVLKADGYGLGAKKIAPVLYQEGCRDFFVAYADEGIELREEFTSRGLHPTIYVLNGFFPGSENDFLRNNLTPTLTDLGQIQRWKVLCKKQEKELQAILHVDTGMSRTGLPQNELHLLSQDSSLLSGIKIHQIISQMVYSDDSNPLFNQLQRHRFEEALKQLPPAPASLAKSGAIFLGQDYHYNLVRPGIALHGVNPTSQPNNPMKPVVNLWTKIYQVQNINTGQSVGYNRTHIAAKPQRIATLAIGYADGYPWVLANTGYVLIAGYRAPIIGRVSMDLVTVDVTHIPETHCQPGVWAQLIGGSLTLEKTAALSGTVPYELLLKLGKRLHRIYTFSESTPEV